MSQDKIYRSLRLAINGLTVGAILTGLLTMLAVPTSAQVATFETAVTAPAKPAPDPIVATLSSQPKTETSLPLRTAATHLPSETVNSAPTKAPISIVGTAIIAGTTKDLSGDSSVLSVAEGTTEDFIPEGTIFTSDMFGGISAVAWTGVGDQYWCLPDRGPLDGAVDWKCRIHKVQISLGAEPNDVKVELLSTVILTDDRGIPFTGLASAFEATTTQTARLDPEGLRVGQNGNLFISDEYGPRLIEFDQAGKMIREFPMPNHLTVANPDVSKKTENPKNSSGRQTNRGMEGLAIGQLHNKMCLVGLMQSPLHQDVVEPTDASVEIVPMTRLNCRMPIFSLDGNFTSEHVYRLEADSNKLNEIVSCGEGRFIVIERDGQIGNNAKFKKLILVDIGMAADVRDVKRLVDAEAANEFPCRCVTKQVLIDLLDPRWNLAGDHMPEKLESLAFGPDFPNGDRRLIVASDNDFVHGQPTSIYVFRIPSTRL